MEDKPTTIETGVSVEEAMGSAYDKITGANPEPTAQKAIAPEETSAEESVDEDTPQAVEAEEETSEEGPEEIEDTPKKTKPPSTWTKAAKAEWEKLPETIKAEILKRENDIQRGFKEKGHEANFGKTIRQKFEPYRKMLNENGYDEAGAVDYFLQLQSYSEQDPAGFVAHMMQTLNVAPDVLAQRLQQPKVYDPAISHLQNEIQNLKQTLSQSETSAITAEIDRFRADKDDFDVLRPLMVSFLSGDIPQAQTLEEAYEMAKYAHPETRKRTLEGQRSAEEEKRRKAMTQKANAARKAASINVKSTDAGRLVKPVNLQDELEAAYDRIASN